MRAKIAKPEHHPQMVELYKGGMTCADIATRFGTTLKRVREIVKNAGVELKQGAEYLKKHYQEDGYFKNIDNSAKAYFLGLLYADGNVYLKRNRVQITLLNEDRYILELFAKYIGYTGKLYNDRGKYTKMIICSKQMVTDLIRAGCVPNKSLLLTFPSGDIVNPGFHSHFIRGYFDGDGCASITSKGHLECSITSTETFLDKLAKVLDFEGIYVSSFDRRYKDNESSAGSIKVSRKSNMKFYKFLYQDANKFCLTRKLEKFRKALEK